MKYKQIKTTEKSNKETEFITVKFDVNARNCLSVPRDKSYYILSDSKDTIPFFTNLKPSVKEMLERNHIKIDCDTKPSYRPVKRINGVPVNIKATGYLKNGSPEHVTISFYGNTRKDIVKYSNLIFSKLAESNIEVLSHRVCLSYREE